MFRRHFKKNILSLCTATLLITGMANTTFAQDKNVWQDKQGNVHVSKSWQKNKNNFGVMLIAVKDLKAFEKSWYRPASKNYTPSIPTVNSATVQDTITMLLMFGGCKAHKNKTCRIYGKMTIKDPKNKVVHTQKIDFYKDRQPRPRIMTVSPVQLGFSLDKGDPLGKYTFEYTVIDSADNTKLNLSREVLFTK